MLRELANEELDLVSGGFYERREYRHPDLPNPWGFDSNSDPIIIVNAPSIQDYDPSFFGSFYARLCGDGTYIKYALDIENHGLWGLTKNWIAIETGTYTVSHTSSGFSAGFPAGVSYTSGSTTYTFDPN